MVHFIELQRVMDNGVSILNTIQRPNMQLHNIRIQG